MEYTLDRRSGGFSIGIGFHVNYPACENILNLFSFVNPYSVVYIPLRIFLELDDVYWRIKSLADVNFVMSKISDPFLRVADRLMTLKGLDEVMNGDGDTKVRDYSVMRAHQPHALVIARLAGNPNFEKLAIDLKNAGNPMGNAPIMDEGWPKLVDYLCNHVAPLV